MIHYVALALLGTVLAPPPTPVVDPIQVRAEVFAVIGSVLGGSKYGGNGMIPYLGLALFGSAVASPPPPVADPIQIRVEAILDLSARCIVDAKKPIHMDELEAALGHLLADSSDTADKSLARLLHYHLGEPAGDELLHGITVRGKRMLPHLEAEKIRKPSEIRVCDPPILLLHFATAEVGYDTAIRYIQEGRTWAAAAPNRRQTVPHGRGPAVAPPLGSVADPIQVRVEAILELSARGIVDPRDLTYENELGVALGRVLTDPSAAADKTLARLLHYYIGESNGEDLLHEITLRGRRMLPLLEAEKRQRPSRARKDYPACILLRVAVDEDHYDTAIRYIKKGEVWGVD